MGDENGARLRLDSPDPRLGGESATQSSLGPAQTSAMSLEDLSRAFADAMQIARTDDSTVRPDSPSTSDSNANSQAEEPGVPITPASILEAVLFVGSPAQSGVPIPSLQEILHGLSLVELEQAVQELNASYQRSEHPWQIVRNGDEFAMELIASMESVVDRMHPPPRDKTLSQNAIDCLSLIAYRPGITKEELETQWGQAAGSTLTTLAKKGLIRSEEESDTSKSCRYFTTERFLNILGVESLDDLPQGEEL